LSKAGYAKVLPKLRIAKEKLAKTDDIRSLSLLETFEEAVRDVSELKLLKGEKIEGGLREIEKTLNTIVAKNIVKLSKITPEPADRLVKSYLCTYVVADVLSLIKRSTLGASLDLGSLATIDIPETPLYGLDEEAAENPKQLASKIRTIQARKLVEKAIDAYQKTGDPGIYDLFYPLVKAYMLQDALSSLDRESRNGVEQVVCPGVIYTLVSGLIYSSRIGIPVETLNLVYEGINVCGFNWSDIRQVYENSGNDPEQLFSELKRKFALFEGRNYMEALKNARSRYLKLSHKKSLSMFAGYPFHAGLVAATIELLEHEVRDIRAVIAGKLYKVYPEKIYAVVTREL